MILSTTVAGPPPKLGYFDQNGDVQTPRGHLKSG